LITLLPVPSVQPSRTRLGSCTPASDGLALAKAALERSDLSCLYIGLTRESAKRIKLWIRLNESELSARFPNGSVIYLVGADSNEDERQKLLAQKFVLVVIDEAQAFTIDLRQLVYGVLKPAVADYRGTIALRIPERPPRPGPSRYAGLEIRRLPRTSSRTRPMTASLLH